MRRDVPLTGQLVSALLLLLGALGPAWAQGTDTEPNNTCQTAQSFGAVALPFTVTGTLGTPSVDFFRFTAPPNSLIVLDLEGEATGRGTLHDPLLGLFDSGCNLLTSDDDGGVGLNAHLGFAVPADGVFIVAATHCCEGGFAGLQPADGSYRLTLTAAGIIRGATVDGLGAAFSAQVNVFTADGKWAARGIPGGAGTYEAYVPGGPSYRVVAQGGTTTRVWYHDQPSFLQANPVNVGVNVQVAGIDLTVPRPVRITPILNQTAFRTNDTLRVGLQVRNPSSGAVSVQVIATAFVPAEPGIDTSTFCCFQDTITLVEPVILPIPPLVDTTVPDALVYRFVGGEPSGPYTLCVRQIQDGLSTQSCVDFTFVP